MLTMTHLHLGALLWPREQLATHLVRVRVRVRVRPGPREQLATHLLLWVALAAEAARGGVAKLVDERTAAHRREVSHP